MSESKYKISIQANADLNDIWSYTFKKWSKQQADRYYELLINEFEFIVDNFMAGKSIDHLRKGYRVTTMKSHLIFYRKTESDLVEVVRILHQRMDIKNRLK